VLINKFLSLLSVLDIMSYIKAKVLVLEFLNQILLALLKTGDIFKVFQVLFRNDREFLQFIVK